MGLSSWIYPKPSLAKVSWEKSEWHGRSSNSAFTAEVGILPFKGVFTYNYLSFLTFWSHLRSEVCRLCQTGTLGVDMRCEADRGTLSSKLLHRLMSDVRDLCFPVRTKLSVRTVCPPVRKWGAVLTPFRKEKKKLCTKCLYVSLSVKESHL